MILPTALFEYGNVSVIAPLVASHLNIAGASYVVVLAVIGYTDVSAGTYFALSLY
jgi:hypothetical protein